MTKSLRISVRSPRELIILKNLGNGTFDFDDLTEEEKILVLTSVVDITDVVEPQKIMEFQREMALEGRLGRRNQIRALVGSMVDRLKPQLEGRR